MTGFPGMFATPTMTASWVDLEESIYAMQKVLVTLLIDLSFCLVVNGAPYSVV